jgi:hypothetical protein
MEAASMASYTAVNGVLLALKQFLDNRMPAELSGGAVNARVQLLGSANIAAPVAGNALCMYVHRIEIDPHGRSRFFCPTGPGQTQRARELPVNLHMLMLAACSSAAIEANLLAWAMIEFANESQLDISHMAENDSSWTEREVLTVTPAEMSNEDLLRIWDALDRPYTTSVPYVVRTIRLRLKEIESYGPEVRARIFPTGRAVVGSAES